MGFVGSVDVGNPQTRVLYIYIFVRIKLNVLVITCREITLCPPFFRVCYIPVKCIGRNVNLISPISMTVLSYVNACSCHGRMLKGRKYFI